MNATEIFNETRYDGTPPAYTSAGGKKRLLIKNDGKHPCAVCGRSDIEEGYSTYKAKGGLGVISESFGESSSLKNPESPIVCRNCEAAVRDEARSFNGVILGGGRSYIIAGLDNKNIGKDGYITMKDVANMLLSPPPPPFVVAFNKNYVGKDGTHFLHKAIVNYSRGSYYASINDEYILVNTNLLSRFQEFLGLHSAPKAAFSLYSMRYILNCMIDLDQIRLEESTETETDDPRLLRKRKYRDAKKEKLIKVIEKEKAFADNRSLLEAIFASSDNMKSIGMYLRCLNAGKAKAAEEKKALKAQKKEAEKNVQ